MDLKLQHDHISPNFHISRSRNEVWKSGQRQRRSPEFQPRIYTNMIQNREFSFKKEKKRTFQNVLLHGDKTGETISQAPEMAFNLMQLS